MAINLTENFNANTNIESQDELSIENLELELLIDAIRALCGTDLSNYSRASLKRRVKLFVSRSQMERISDIIPFIVKYPEQRLKIFEDIMVSVSELFRTPFAFLTLKK